MTKHVQDKVREGGKADSDGVGDNPGMIKLRGTSARKGIAMLAANQVQIALCCAGTSGLAAVFLSG